MDEPDHKIEAKIKWQSERSYLIETTIPIGGWHMFWLSKKRTCAVEDPVESNGDGNWMFTVSDWWFRNAESGEKFRADERS